MTANKATPELLARLNNYLGNGGFWNPDLMEHEKVRDLILDVRDFLAADLIESLQSELAKQRGRIEKIEADIGAEMLELAERCELFADSVNEHYELDLNDIAKLLRASHSARTKAIAECLLICKERDDQDERDNGAAATGAAYLCMQDISMLSDGPSEALSPDLIESLQNQKKQKD